MISAGWPRPAYGAYTDAKPLKFKGTFDPFRVLGLPRQQALPEKEVLRKAFKKAALKWHPDRCKRSQPVEVCEARMEEVHLAQDVLSDERRLQQWEAWDEDRRGGPKPEAGRTKPFGQPAGAGGPQGFPGFSGPSGFGGFPFSPGAGGRKKPRRPRPAQAPPPPPAPKPPAPPPSKLPWKVTSREKVAGPRGVELEMITRERDLPGTNMVQIEVVEKTCYAAQVQCQEKVVERRRRRQTDAPSSEL